MRRGRRRHAPQAGGGGRFERFAGFLTRRARLVVVAWLTVVAALALLGRNLEHELNANPVIANGTQSERAHDIVLREFGSEYAIVVMLRGPADEVERQGRDLASRLGRMRRMLVVSPWTRGAAVAGLRPKPGVVALVVRAESIEAGEAVGLLPPIERQVDAAVSGPVHASIAGFPSVLKSIFAANEEATTLGEFVALPVLMIVLLLVFRSVFAALMPVVIGGAVVAAARGVLSLLLHLTTIDLFALGVVGMLGLALGVDYSLLVVSRFREERQRHEVPVAAQRTMVATTRSVLPAGCGLIFAMFTAPLMLPGEGVSSVAIAVSVVAVLSMLSALCVVPALLTLVGENLDRFSFRRRQGSQMAPLRWARRLAAKPRAVVAITLLLVFLSGWALTLQSGAASIALLPPGDTGRVQQEEVEDALGPGWTAPMEVVMNGRGSPVTSSQRLDALADFQRQVERDPGVETVAGFARIAKSARGLRGIEGGLADQERGLVRLDRGISRLHRGATLNTSGLLAAADGARRLDSGLGAANGGAGLLADSLQSASSGSQRLAAGLGQVSDGSGKLAQGTTQASTGAQRLADGLERAEESTAQIHGSARLLQNAMRSGEDRLNELHSPLQAGGEQLGAAWQALQRMSAGRADPEYAAAVRALEEANRQLNGTDIRTGEPVGANPGGVERGVERAEGQFGVGSYLSSKLDENGRQAQKGVKKLAQGSERLDRGLRRLASGSRRLSTGIAALSRGGQKLSPGMSRLSEGATRLSAGMGLLETGAGRLATGLGGGAQKSKLLSGGLRRVSQGLEKQDGSGGGSGLGQLKSQSPHLFRSSYFVLAALDGTSSAQRQQLGFLVNLDRGGQTARMLVIPRDDPTSAATKETKDRLEADATDLGRKTGTEVVLGGVAPAEIAANDQFRGRAPLMRLVLSLISFLVLVPVMRSLTIPLLAALLNLIAVGASFGLLALLFDTSLLGGPGFVDASVIPATIVVMFGLAIDYEVFVFARIREEYLRTGSTRAAVAGGLDRTAHVVTGAALIMIAVFLAFSLSPYISIRNFGVAQAIGIFIDAFVVRLIIIPALMNKLGRWSWWMPSWLDRLLPGGGSATAVTEGQETA